MQEAYDYIQAAPKPGRVDQLNRQIRESGYEVPHTRDGWGDNPLYRMKVKPEEVITDLARMARQLLDGLRVAAYEGLESGNVPITSLPDIEQVLNDHPLGTFFVHEVRPRSREDIYAERVSGFNPIRTCTITRHPRPSADLCGGNYDRNWRRRNLHGDVK